MIIHKPKWSYKDLYYCADYRTYRMLKALKRWWYESQHDAHEYKRWVKKTKYTYTKPAVMPCPRFHSVHSMGYGCAWVKEASGLRHSLLGLVERARCPSEVYVDEFDSVLMLWITKLYEDVVKWRQENGLELDSFLGSPAEPQVSQE
jgi:hypothetical protein